MNVFTVKQKKTNIFMKESLFVNDSMRLLVRDGSLIAIMLLILKNVKMRMVKTGNWKCNCKKSKLIKTRPQKVSQICKK